MCGSYLYIMLLTCGTFRIPSSYTETNWLLFAYAHSYMVMYCYINLAGSCVLLWYLLLWYLTVMISYCHLYSVIKSPWDFCLISICYKRIPYMYNYVYTYYQWIAMYVIVHIVLHGCIITNSLLLATNIVW